MAIQNINVGAQPNDGTGDANRTAWQKTNANVAELDSRTSAAQSSATNAGAAAAASQTTANTARTEAAAANANANTRIPSTLRNVAGGVANLNAVMRLNYAMEILMTAQAGNNGRVYVAPAGLHNNNSGTTVGCYVIKLSSVTSMNTVHARAFNYGLPTAGRGVTEFVAGLYHTTGTAAGAYPSSSLSHFGAVVVPVSFAIETATGRRCVVVGAVNQAWVFGMLEVLDATSHRSTIAGATGIDTVDVEFVTNLDAYNSVTLIPDSGPYATANAALALGNAAFPVRATPANGTDLNDLRDPGVYPIPTQAIGSTLLNMPAGMTTGVIVVYPVSGAASVVQQAIRSDARFSANRRFASSAWNTWDIDLTKSTGVSLEGFLTTGTDLNTLTAAGTQYAIGTNAIGASLLNAPVPLAGYLEVLTWSSSGYVIQRYTAYSNGKQYTRFQTSPTAWQAWTEQAQLSAVGGTLPVAMIPTGIPVANITGAAPLASPAFTGTVTGITAAMVGLGNVNNTADTAKPVSTAMQTALNLKFNLSGGTVAGATAFTSGVNFNSGINLPQIGGGSYSGSVVMYGGGYMRGAAVNGGGIEMINVANSERNFFFRDDGVFMPRSAIRM